MAAPLEPPPALALLDQIYNLRGQVRLLDDGAANLAQLRRQQKLSKADAELLARTQQWYARRRLELQLKIAELEAGLINRAPVTDCAV